MFESLTWHAYLTVLFYGVGEAALTLQRQADQQAKKADAGSLYLIWMVIPAAILMGLLLGRQLAFADMPFFREHHTVGIVTLCSGILLRVYAIVYLGKFFTVNVAIAEDHRVIDSGPYRWVRHPSYTGVLLVYLGIGLCLANWMALLVILLPTTAIMLWRIRIEERALHTGLGAAYTAYVQKTRRLLPWIF